MRRSDPLNSKKFRIGFDAASTRYALALGALLLLGFALRVYRLAEQDIWWDEGRNIFTASRALGEIASASELDIHPPLYFYILHLWMQVVGNGEFVVRFGSVAFSLALIALAFRVGAQLRDATVGVWASFLVALSPLLVDEAHETRMYSLLIFLALLSCYFLVRALATRQRVFWLWYAFSAAASFYTHYSFIYFLAAQNLFLAIEFFRRERTRSFFAAWIASQAMIALLYAFQAPNILRQMQIYGNPGMMPPALIDYLLQLASGFLLGVKVDPARAAWLGAGWVVIALVAFGALAARFRFTRGVMLALTCLIVSVAAYFFVLRFSPQFTPRYAMIAAPPLYVLFACALGALSARSFAAGALSALALLAINAGALESTYYNPVFFNDDTRGLARFIAQTATRDDIIFTDAPFAGAYYYRGAAEARYLGVDIHTTAAELTQRTQGKRNIFWIHWTKSDIDPLGYVPYLLDKYALFIGQASFRGYDVVWYRLPRTPNFALADSPQPTGADFGERLRLSAFAFGGAATSATPDVNQPRVALGSKIWIALWWQMTAPMAEEYTVSLVLRDANGNTLAQEDRRMVNDRHLTTRFWRPDEIAVNVYAPELEASARPGMYDLYIIVYDPVSGKRLNVGAGDAFLLGKMEIVPGFRD